MFCNKCGTENKDTSKFCRKCGNPFQEQEEEKAVASSPEIKGSTKIIKDMPPTTQVKDTLGLPSNIGGLLCYVLFWVSGIVCLFLEKKDDYVRFHAWQSIITFGALTIPLWILNWISVLGSILFYFLQVLYWIVLIFALILWVVLMYKAYRGELYKLPVAGDIAWNLVNKK